MERAEKNGRMRALSCPDQSIQRGGYLVWEQYVASLKVQLVGCGLRPGDNYRFALETKPGGKILFAPARFDIDTQEYASSFSSPAASCLFFLQGDMPLLYAPMAGKYDIAAAIGRLREALAAKPRKLTVQQEKPTREETVKEAPEAQISAAQERQEADAEKISQEKAEKRAEETVSPRPIPKVPSCFKNWRRYSPPEMLEKYASLSSFITCPDGSRFASVPLSDESLILGELPVEDHIINICAYPAVTNPALKPAETSLSLPLRNGKTCWTSEELIK